MNRIAYFAVALLTVQSQAHAQQFEDLETLEAQVSSKAGAPVQAIDKRIRLARCPDAVTIDPPALGAVAVRCVPLGWRLRVTLLAERNQPERTAPIFVIRRGDEVELSVIGDGFELITHWVALEEAEKGQSVRVKSLTSQTVVRGIAIAPGVVEVSR